MTKQDVKDRLTVPDGVELVYSDACDLPVGVHDHRRMSLKKKIVLLLVAIAAAAGWGTIALSRGETVNGSWFLHHRLHVLRAVYRIQGGEASRRPRYPRRIRQ
mgnify:CR=1 FL=1